MMAIIFIFVAVASAKNTPFWPNGVRLVLLVTVTAVALSFLLPVMVDGYRMPGTYFGEFAILLNFIVKFGIFTLSYWIGRGVHSLYLARKR